MSFQEGSFASPAQNKELPWPGASLREQSAARSAARFRLNRAAQSRQPIEMKPTKLTACFRWLSGSSQTLANAVKY